MSSEMQELRAGCLFTESSEESILRALSAVRAGNSLNPPSWPNRARVAVTITFDVDHEFPVYKLDPALLSLGEYGATTGLPRILTLLKHHGIPATFFVPGMTQRLHPETIPEILAQGPHEVGIHGWVHERAPDLRDRAEEESFIARSIEVITQAAGGVRPLGYRAPNAAISEHTLDILEQFGLSYDSSLSGSDEPYELLLKGRKSKLIEVPISWENGDYTFLHSDEFWQGSLPWPQAVLDSWKKDYDMAYSEGTIFNLTLHPQVIGRRSRISILDELLSYIRTKDDVWFATLGQVVNYIQGASR